MAGLFSNSDHSDYFKSVLSASIALRRIVISSKIFFAPYRVGLENFESMTKRKSGFQLD
jgi:hypothetical protein